MPFRADRIGFGALGDGAAKIGGLIAPSHRFCDGDEVFRSVWRLSLRANGM